MPAQDRARSVLPEGTLPRGLSRQQAASYIGISATLFDTMVADGRMPSPKIINARRVWDRHQLDACFDELPNVGGTRDESDDVWDEVAV